VDVAKDKKQPGGTKTKSKKASAPKASASKSSARPKAQSKSQSKSQSKAKASSSAKSVKKAVSNATARARDLASNPAMAEIVAASLVAAAAAIRNPKKARDMAAAVGDELETASKQSIDRGNSFWQLAIDIARRSMDVLGTEPSPTRSKSRTKKKPKK
jgi:hypothetical protein